MNAKRIALIPVNAIWTVFAAIVGLILCLFFMGLEAIAAHTALGRDAGNSEFWADYKALVSACAHGRFLAELF